MSAQSTSAERDNMNVEDRPISTGPAHVDDGSLAMYAASELLREKALTDPDRVFLEVGDTRITYRELDDRVDRLAQWLLDSVGEKDRRIGLHTTGTEALVVGSLGLRRAGMTSVCLDPTAPAPWVGRALADCGAVLLLSDSAQASSDIPCPVVHPCAVGTTPPPGGVRTATGTIGSIVYTSGSTGEPKGVVIASAQQLSRELSMVGVAAQAAGPGGARIGFLGFGSVGFMETVVHLGVALDATLVGYDIRSDGIHGLGKWLADNHIWAVVAVPTLLRHVLATLPADLEMPELRLVVLYGEAATWEDLAALWPHVGHDTTVVALYGSSESQSIAMFVVTSSTPREGGRLPAGMITSEVRVTIENPEHQVLPDGEIGEIVAWTKRSALGYWNRPEETAAIFGISEDRGPYVRTGDLGRFRPDGLLEHLGRMDDMVKVSGHRVMLTEVESVMAQLPGTAAAAAVPRTDALGDTRIVAFVVPDHGSTLDPAALHDVLKVHLPPAAVPDRVHVVTHLPLLPNGKVDRLVLREGNAPPPVPDSIEPEEPEAAAEMVAAILAIWSDILGVETHEDDNFFDLGGDSLRAARLFAEIELQLGADLPLSLLVEASTPRTLAAAIAADGGHDNLVVPIRTAGSRPPLFILHDASGSVLFARVMAGELHEDQPVYGIRAEALLGVVTAAESIQEVASRYLPAILDIAPDTCALYGPSAGGVIAFELALQLAEKGVDVTFLGMADSLGPGYDLTSLPRGRDPRERRQRRLNDLKAAPWTSRPRLAAGFLWRRSVAAIRHRLTSQQRDLRAGSELVHQAVERSRLDGTPLPREYRSAYAIGHYGGLSVTYRPVRPFHGPIALLRTADKGPEDRGWKDYVTGSVRVFPLPDFHYQLLEEDTVRRTGKTLAEALRRW